MHHVVDLRCGEGRAGAAEKNVWEHVTFLTILSWKKCSTIPSECAGCEILFRTFKGEVNAFGIFYPSACIDPLSSCQPNISRGLALEYFLVQVHTKTRICQVFQEQGLLWSCFSPFKRSFQREANSKVYRRTKMADLDSMLSILMWIETLRCTSIWQLHGVVCMTYSQKSMKSVPVGHRDVRKFIVTYRIACKQRF